MRLCACQSEAGYDTDRNDIGEIFNLRAHNTSNNKRPHHVEVLELHLIDDDAGLKDTGHCQGRPEDRTSREEVRPLRRHDAEVGHIAWFCGIEQI